MTPRTTVGALLLAAAVLLFAAPAAEAADVRIYAIANGTGVAASDLHVTFRNTGGSLTAAVLVNPPGCPAPAIPSNGTVTNTMVVDWGVACVAPGAAVTVRVSTGNGPLRLADGFWTAPGRQGRPGIGPVDPERDVEELEEEPRRKDDGDDDGPFCCKYLCFDAEKRPYLIEFCNDEECDDRLLGPGDHACQHVGVVKVETCKECPSKVLTGRCKSPSE